MYNVINSTIQELLDKLRAEIQSIVYDGNVPEWYTRTYEILNNWTAKSFNKAILNYVF